MQKIRAKIHLNNIRHNAEIWQRRMQGKLCAVVKANAYGHGAEAVVAALCDVADCFAVALIEEGQAIRVAACDKDILVFTPPTDLEEGYALAVNRFIGTVDCLKTARLLSYVCQRYRLSLRVHLKVNTGMNRYGMNAQTLGKVCKYLQGDPYVQVCGVYSHLCQCDKGRAEEQRRLFERMRTICQGYFPTATAHLGGTYAAMLGEKYTYDMVRVGLGLYGYLPCKCGEKLHLKKGMTVYAKTVADRKFVFGGAGYGKPLQEKPRRLSVCRVGYADGFLRKQKNGMVGWEENANHLCMDACIRYGEGLRGAWMPIMTNAEDTAKKAGTIAYEVLCAATRRAEFVYEDEVAFCGNGTGFAKREKGALACVYEE